MCLRDFSELREGGRLVGLVCMTQAPGVLSYSLSYDSVSPDA